MSTGVRRRGGRGLPAVTRRFAPPCGSSCARAGPRPPHPCSSGRTYTGETVRTRPCWRCGARPWLVLDIRDLARVLWNFVSLLACRWCFLHVEWYSSMNLLMCRRGWRNGRAGSRKPRRVSEHEARLYRHEIWAKVVTKIGRAAVSWAGFAFCIYWAAQAAVEWSGQTTLADFRLSLLGGGWRDFAVLLGTLVGAGGLAYGCQCRRLMRQTVHRFEGPKRARETALDPHRSSSGLTRSGEPPDEED